MYAFNETRMLQPWNIRKFACDPSLEPPWTEPDLFGAEHGRVDALNGYNHSLCLGHLCLACLSLVLKRHPPDSQMSEGACNVQKSVCPPILTA